LRRGSLGTLMYRERTQKGVSSERGLSEGLEVRLAMRDDTGAVLRPVKKGKEEKREVIRQKGI